MYNVISHNSTLYYMKGDGRVLRNDKIQNNPTAKLVDEKKRKRNLFSKLGTVVMIIFLLYLSFSVISQRMEYNEQKKNLDALTSQISEAREANDEYTRLLSGDDQSEYMKKIAIERYGYAYPNERRYFIASES